MASIIWTILAIIVFTTMIYFICWGYVEKERRQVIGWIEDLLKDAPEEQEKNRLRHHLEYLKNADWLCLDPVEYYCNEVRGCK